mgnify:CR=1 FL=1
MSHIVAVVRLIGMSSVIVIGGGYAGLMTANRALVRGHRVTLLTDRDRFVDRIRLHEVIAGTRTPTGATHPYRLGRGGTLVVGRATRVGEGGAQLDDGRDLEADHIALATGSGSGAGGWAWAVTHRDAVAALRPGGRVVVRGGGFTGIEVATEIADARPDLRVTLVDPRDAGSCFSPRGRQRLDVALERLRVERATTDVDHDHAIDCTGLTADSLAAGSGLPVDERGAVEVDEHLRVRGTTRVWAVGDAARVRSQPHLRMACATAEPMGLHLADQLGHLDRGERLEPFTLGYAMWCLSLGRRDGLIEYVRRDDTPTDRILTGRAAAVVKEFVCRGAVIAPMRLSRFYRGLEGPRER